MADLKDRLLHDLEKLQHKSYGHHHSHEIKHEIQSLEWEFKEAVDHSRGLYDTTWTDIAKSFTRDVDDADAAFEAAL